MQRVIKILAFILSVATLNAYGQNRNDTVEMVRDLQQVEISGERINLRTDRREIRKVYSLEELQHSRQIYFFDRFTDGIAVFKNGDTIPAKFNYNLLSERIHFIQNDSILELTTPRSEINFIRIESTYFFPHPQINRYLVAAVEGYVSILFSIRIAYELRADGGYGAANSTSGARALSSLSTQVLQTTGEGAVANVSVNIENLEHKVTFRVEDDFFLYHNGRMSAATRNNLIRFFPSKFRRSINDYIWENTTNFSSFEDLKAIVEHFNAKMN
jgi:hypothetical protein